MDSWSSSVHASLDSVCTTTDGLFVLAFSTIMLNTDLHNDAIRDDRRMTLEQFVRNNRGVDGGEDIRREVLEEVYEGIRLSPIAVGATAGEEITDIGEGDIARGEAEDLEGNTT